VPIEGPPLTNLMPFELPARIEPEKEIATPMLPNVAPSSS
jgi:hypothetical protein